ncbi:Miniconductance mechanosensitive channel MscM [Mixta intestinalis]|uniref:Miniconductance mechanosensitive channel MscM n=2 Tax=Mixta intestinalis TaxID=1615494 RepID=A0A6P1PW70_9GAMM|nr:Miniconductance mechanosensitive channel MscM [Mixta intestinalis]
MAKWLRLMRASLLALLALAPLYLHAADDGDASTATAEDETAVKVNAAVELPKMQKILDKIKGQVSDETNDAQLSQLNDMALELSGNADTLGQALIPQSQQLISQLAVLGPAPKPDSGVKETPEVTRKRAALENQKQKLDDQIKQAEAIKSGSLNLSAQIVNLRRDNLKTQLALNSGSIFGSRFWSPLFNVQQLDGEKLASFRDELVDTAALAWEPGWRAGTLLWLVAAVLLATLGRRYGEEFLAWVSIHQLPEGRLRRSFLAAAIALTTLVAVVMAFSFLDQALTRRAEVSDDVHDFVDRLVQLSVFCGLIAGLGRAFLSTRRPSWRLPAISNEVAMALKPFPPLTATLVFIFQTVEALNSSVGTSVGTTILANGLTALLVGATALSISFRSSRVRRRLVQEGQTPEAKSTLVGLIQMAITLAGLAILLSLAVGYVTLARFLSYELVWLGIVCGAFYFLSHLLSDGCETLLSVNNPSGKRIQTSLNIDARHLSQAAALLSALGKTILLLFAAVAVLNGTFGTSTPIELLQKAVEFWGGKGLETLNIVPAHLVNALLCLVIGIYVLRSVRRWLDNEFLPKTTMDTGMRVSLVTLFSNIGYVLVILLTLSTMGVQWNKLAWIVSALSVGIGFGLQEIVKNFISGLILLTERPVKVGDLVSISGIEGDIRRINVRATEIQLSDKSTVIVPNSQLISQNVRNATMGNAQGVVTIMLTFPLDIDPVQVREILLAVYNENERILETPEPSVSFKDLTPQGIVLSVTGNVATQRQVGSAKSDLLFDMLTRLRKEGIVLSRPQTMIIEQKNGDVVVKNPQQP